MEQVNHFAGSRWIEKWDEPVQHRCDSAADEACADAKRSTHVPKIAQPRFLQVITNGGPPRFLSLHAVRLSFLPARRIMDPAEPVTDGRCGARGNLRLRRGSGSVAGLAAALCALPI